MGKCFQSRILDSETIGLYYLVQLKYKGITFLFFLPNSALPFLREMSLFPHGVLAVKVTLPLQLFTSMIAQKTAQVQ